MGNCSGSEYNRTLYEHRCGRTAAEGFAIIPGMSSQPRHGRFITFEGLDGCGKTTQLEKLGRVLRKEGVHFVATREPGGTPAGEVIRNLLLDTATVGLSPWTELCLMFTSRVQHLAEIIDPALARGDFVLCDRFTDSTEAYQGGGRKLGSEPVLELHRILCHNLQPDMTILMDSDIAASVERARRRNQARIEAGEIDEGRFEKENRAFFGRVRNKFLEIAKRDPKRVFLVDARGTPDETHAKVVEAMRERLKT